MSWDNKVVWSEGLFLQPQHFQQYDRYVERLVRGGVGGLRPFAWGIRELTINHDLLTLGKFAITSCHGILEDGTPFNVPDDADHPPPLVVPENTRDCIVYLTLPARQPGAKDVVKGDAEETMARYSAREFETRDAIVGSEGVTTLEVGKLRLRFSLETDERAGHVCLGVARIVEIRADKQIVLDENYIPPCLDCAASSVLGGYVAELQGLLHHRGEALAGRVSESGTKGVAEIADFLLLQTVNRYEPYIAHMASISDVHPETFYGAALQVCGDLSTFTAQNKRPIAFPVYQHDNLTATFARLIKELRQSLSAVLEQNAIPLSLEERKYGIHVAVIVDKRLLTSASFVLAVRANVQAERLRRNFPNQAKLGPVEKIRELVNVALPGIGLRPLPVAPRQIPYHAGVTYFELDNTSEFFRELQGSGGLAIHVAGEFPELDMELWAIKG